LKQKNPPDFGREISTWFPIFSWDLALVSSFIELWKGIFGPSFKVQVETRMHGMRAALCKSINPAIRLLWNHPWRNSLGPL